MRVSIVGAAGQSRQTTTARGASWTAGLGRNAASETSTPAVCRGPQPHPTAGERHRRGWGPETCDWLLRGSSDPCGRRVTSLRTPTGAGESQKSKKEGEKKQKYKKSCLQQPVNKSHLVVEATAANFGRYYSESIKTASSKEGKKLRLRAWTHHYFYMDVHAVLVADNVVFWSVNDWTPPLSQHDIA